MTKKTPAEFLEHLRKRTPTPEKRVAYLEKENNAVRDAVKDACCDSEGIFVLPSGTNDWDTIELVAFLVKERDQYKEAFCDIVSVLKHVTHLRDIATFQCKED